MTYVICLRASLITRQFISVFTFYIQNRNHIINGIDRLGLATTTYVLYAVCCLLWSRLSTCLHTPFIIHHTAHKHKHNHNHSHKLKEISKEINTDKSNEHAGKGVRQKMYANFNAFAFTQAILNFSSKTSTFFDGIKKNPMMKYGDLSVNPLKSIK